MREAYRLQKTPLLELLQEQNIQLQIGINFLADTMPVYADIYQQTGKFIARLSEKIRKESKA